MWQVYINPETGNIDLFTEDGHELKHLTDLKIGQSWNGADGKRDGFVELSFNGYAKLVFEKPKTL
jgi:hypothetical protein